MESRNNAYIRRIISDIKKSRKRIWTNYLPEPNVDDNKTYETIVDSETIVFCDMDGAVKRGYYYSSDQKQLLERLQSLPQGTTIEYYSKSLYDGAEYLTEAGFQKVTVLQKVSTADLEDLKNNALWQAYCDAANEHIGVLAQESDADEICRLMREVFDPYIDHIPTKEELVRDFIDRQGALIHRAAGKIVGFSLYKIQGKKMFSQSIYSENDLEVVASLSLKVNNIAEKQGISYTYGYVDINNKKSSEWQRKLSSKFEDMFDHIYVKK